MTLDALKGELDALEDFLDTGDTSTVSHDQHAEMIDRAAHLRRTIVNHPHHHWQAFAGPRFAAARLNPDNPADQQAIAWLANRARGNLGVFGPVGTGKTHLVYATAHQLAVDQFSRVLAPGTTYTAAESAGYGDACITGGSVVDLLDQLRPDGGLTVKDLVKPAYLIVDDIGVERLTDWAAEKVYAVIDGRWRNENPTLFTTNLTTADLKTAVGERIYDRLRHDATTITLKGASRRNPIRAA